MTGASDGLVRLWSLEEVYKQAQEATWGLPSDSLSAHSTCTDAASHLGQEVTQGQPACCSSPESSKHEMTTIAHTGNALMAIVV